MEGYQASTYGDRIADVYDQCSAGWRREPFTGAARGHVSVYERA